MDKVPSLQETFLPRSFSLFKLLLLPPFLGPSEDIHNHLNSRRGVIVMMPSKTGDGNTCLLLLLVTAGVGAVVELVVVVVVVTMGRIKRRVFFCSRSDHARFGLEA